MSIAGKAFGALRGIGVDFSTPGLAFGVGAPVTMALGQGIYGVGEAVRDEFVGTRKIIDEEIRRRRLEASRAMKARRLQEAMSQNMMRLAAVNPQLYNQLLIGRMLPQGAVVIGGGKSSDFLDSVAYQMATGGFDNPQGTPDSEGMIQALAQSL